MNYWTLQDNWIGDLNQARLDGENELTFDKWLIAVRNTDPRKSVRIAASVALREARAAASCR